MTASLRYEFAGTDGLFDLSGCAEVAKLLPSVFHIWLGPGSDAARNSSEC